MTIQGRRDITILQGADNISITNEMAISIIRIQDKCLTQKRCLAKMLVTNFAGVVLIGPPICKDVYQKDYVNNYTCTPDGMVHKLLTQ